MKRLTLLALLLAVGCMSSATKSTNTSPLASPKPVSDIPVTLTEINVVGLDKALASHAGNVVVVDAWFLGCGPCVKKFPSFVELHHKYKESGVNFISLDVMPSEVSSSKQVTEFLTDKKAVFTNYILNDTEAKVDGWFEARKFTSTPAVLFYDRRGDFVKSLEAPSVEKIEATIRELLAGK
jgi:thiol-disulfide isomerase/thioredoxin